MNRTLLALLVLFLAINSGAMAQSDNDNIIEIRIKGGWYFLNNDLFDREADTLEDNWSISGELVYWFSDSFGIGAELEYYKKETDEFFDASPFEFLTVQATSNTMIPFNMNAYYRWQVKDNQTRPYVSAGLSAVYYELGTAWIDGGSIIPGAERTDDEFTFGLNVAGGIEYGRFFTEVQWLWAESDLLDAEEAKNVGGTSVWFGVRF